MSECLLRHTLPIRSTSGRSWEQTTVSLRTASRCHLASFLLWLVGRIIPQKELMRRWLEPCWAAEMLPHTDPGPCLCMVAHVPLLHFWARPAEGAGGKQDLSEEVPYVPLSPRHCSQPACRGSRTEEGRQRAWGKFQSSPEVLHSQCPLQFSRSMAALLKGSAYSCRPGVSIWWKSSETT